jgi:hypothetical protein
LQKKAEIASKSRDRSYHSEKAACNKQVERIGFMPFPQPLIELGVFYSSGKAPNLLREDQATRLAAIFAEFIADPSSMERAMDAITRMGYDPKAITKVSKILATEGSQGNLGNLSAALGTRSTPSDGNHRQRAAAWSADEDDRLLAGIYHYGLTDWLRVAQFVGGGRSRAQCGQRWLRCLDPSKKKDKWLPEEDQKLISLVELYGNRSWAKIARELGTRTDVQCRYRYIHHMPQIGNGGPHLGPIRVGPIGNLSPLRKIGCIPTGVVQNVTAPVETNPDV